MEMGEPGEREGLGEDLFDLVEELVCASGGWGRGGMKGGLPGGLVGEPLVGGEGGGR